MIRIKKIEIKIRMRKTTRIRLNDKLKKYRHFSARITQEDAGIRTSSV